MAHMEFTELKDVADIHQALSDPLRILIVRVLLERELCVCEIVRALKEPQYKVSRHLAVLKKAGLLRGWRDGIWMHYQIHPALSPEWRNAIESLSHAWDTNRDVQAALWRLQKCATRPPELSEVCETCGR
jgi:DNA-binding transcriptional ArsR family regulator